MGLFLLSFILVYGGLHAYAFVSARRAIGFGTPAAVLVACCMAVMVAAPILVRLAEHHGMENTGRALAYVGYIWMGLLFLFFSASVALHLYHGLLWVAGKSTAHQFTPLALSPRPAFFAAAGFSCFASLYGAWEARNITTEKVVITTPKIPATVGKVTIVQVSDVHLGLIVREGRVQRILDAVRQAAPDVLVSTGDLVDGQLDGLAGLAQQFATLNPRYGKFAVTGNHEFYAGLKPALQVSTDAGLTMLRGDHAPVAGCITIAGVDDPAGERSGGLRGLAEQDLLAGLPRDRFVVLLKHRPTVDRDSIGLFDLQLSGHVHKGQLFPFNLLTFLLYPVHTGHTSYPSGSSLYVSRGTGTWGPPIRFLAPPEVTVIELVHGTGSESST